MFQTGRAARGLLSFPRPALGLVISEDCGMKKCAAAKTRDSSILDPKQ